MAKHKDKYQTRDSCREHGFGGSPCRIHQKAYLVGSFKPKHRADVPVEEASPRP